MKQKSKLLTTLGIMLLFVLFATQANAQNITVTGTVSDNLGPVIGASIQVEGTSNGCITDIDGNYRQTVHNMPPSSMARFLFLRLRRLRLASIWRLFDALIPELLSLIVFCYLFIRCRKYA